MINPKSSFPVFIVQNIEKAREFYCKHFSFNPVFSGDWYIHLVSESGVQIGFLSPDQPSQPEIFHKAFNGLGTIFSIEVDDAEASYSSAMENSLDIALDLRSEDWGQKHFVVTDPNGIKIDVVESFEPSDEYKSDYVP